MSRLRVARDEEDSVEQSGSESPEEELRVDVTGEVQVQGAPEAAPVARIGAQCLAPVDRYAGSMPAVSAALVAMVLSFQMQGRLGLQLVSVISLWFATWRASARLGKAAVRVVGGALGTTGVLVAASAS